MLFKRSWSLACVLIIGEIHCSARPDGVEVVTRFAAIYRGIRSLEAPRHTVTRFWRATLGSAKAKLNYYRPVVRLSLYISRNLCSVLYVGQNTRVEPLCWTSLVCVKKNITAFASSTCTLSMSTSRRPCKDYQK